MNPIHLFRVSLPVVRCKNNQHPTIQQTLDIRADDYVVAPDRTLTLRMATEGAEDTKKPKPYAVATFQPHEWSNIVLIAAINELKIGIDPAYLKQMEKQVAAK